MTLFISFKILFCYLQRIYAAKRNEGYVLSYVMQFIRDRCSYEVKNHYRINMRKFDFWDITMCQINPAHGVVIYQAMIFDKNYVNHLKENDKNLTILAHNRFWEMMTYSKFFAINHD